MPNETGIDGVPKKEAIPRSTQPRGVQCTYVDQHQIIIGSGKSGLPAKSQNEIVRVWLKETKLGPKDNMQSRFEPPFVTKLISFFQLEP
jgi:hypothetical protein